MNKRLMMLLGLTGLLLVAAGFVYFGRGSLEAAYKLESVTQGDISLVITATGKINPVTRVQVGTQITGTISRIYADYNQKVKKGEVIAQIDPTFLKAQLLEGEANAERAKAQVEQARKTLERATELFGRKLISQAEKDEASTNYDLAQANLKQAQAAYHRAEVSLQYATIVSPIDGVVISRNIDVGQTVAASLQAPVLFEIANDLSKIQVEAIIDEVDIGKVRVGQDVSFFVDAYPDSRFIGRVSQVRLQPIVTQNLVGYEVIIDASNEENKLLPGMTANLSIIIDTKKDVVKVPNMALRFQPALTQDQYRRFLGELGDRFDLKNNTMVWVLTPTKDLRPVIIQTGISDGLYTEVRDGSLKTNMEVITGLSNVATTSSAAQRLAPGKK